ncbi:MAG: hypothetical protein BZ136_00285 [Methanosphaera sp. rholeuAM74]|nr:MAG: hypothetical protein BZ136_00285 [Methanosphaera sp. rholeuAM74]
MDNQYTNVAKRIKRYLEENNLGDFTKEEYEEKFERFYNTFSPEILSGLDGGDVRDTIFLHDGDKNNLCYTLEFSKEYGEFCGGIGGGTSYKYHLFKNKSGQWVAGGPNNNRVLDDSESVGIAISIRDAIVDGAKYISNARLDSVDDYVDLGKALKDIFHDCHVSPTNSWIHKYYSIIFPDILSSCHQKKMKEDILRKFHLNPSNNFWANDGHLSLLSREAGIKLYCLFDEGIVGLFYRWDKNMWTDKFNKYNLVDTDSVRYWAFTPGVMADRFDLCYDNSVMCMGWNYLGDLSEYDDDFEESLNELIKRTENLKVKPTSAVRSLSAIYKNIKAGDVICVRRGLSTILAIGRVLPDSKYFYDESMDESVNDPYYHFRDGIRWLKLEKEYEFGSSKFLRDTLYEITDESMLDVIHQLEGKLTENVVNANSSLGRNVIYFGAPGTGKSYTLNADMSLIVSDEDCYERVTFHPDYSYANFVGTYKPVSSSDGISYDYVPGPFIRMLVKAYRNPGVNHLLVIEEINRANVSAVFGDIFQLLDRDNSGRSRYPIDASEDIRKYLEEELNTSHTKIGIPSNLFIWATMNSADQGVFPMDTAFKRRWDFNYFGIDNNEELITDMVVDLNGNKISWNELRKAINEELLSYKINEDKLLGPFFAFDDYIGRNIPVEEFKKIFKNKVLMYLFEDVARSKRNSLFSGVRGNGNYVYSRICDEFDEKGVEIFCNNISDQFIDEDEG